MKTANFENIQYEHSYYHYDGMDLLSLAQLEGTIYLVKWADLVTPVTAAPYDIWLFIECSKSDLGLFHAKQLSLHELEKLSPNIYQQSQMEECATRVEYADVVDYMAVEGTIFDESFMALPEK